MDATTTAVDLAKDVFEVALANRAGRILEGKRLTRRQFERFIDSLPAGTAVIMEACGTAHYWGRRCQERALSVQLLPPQYVRPYVRRNKTDRTDAEALLEAARGGVIRPVRSRPSNSRRCRRSIGCDVTGRLTARPVSTPCEGCCANTGCPLASGPEQR